MSVDKVVPCCYEECGLPARKFYLVTSQATRYDLRRNLVAFCNQCEPRMEPPPFQRWVKLTLTEFLVAEVLEE